MKAKIISALLAILLIGFLLTGCSTARISELETQVNNQKARVDELKGEISAKDTKIDDLETQITGLKGEMSAKDDKVGELETEVAELQTELAEAHKGPSYDELMSFLVEDQVDENEFSYPTYSSLNFALDLKSNAKKKGIPAALVIMTLPEKYQFLCAFDTEDRGLIYIEPQSDDEVTVELGISYRSQNNYRSVFFDDTILQVNLAW